MNRYYHNNTQSDYYQPDEVFARLEGNRVTGSALGWCVDITLSDDELKTLVELDDVVTTTVRCIDSEQYDATATLVLLDTDVVRVKIW